ncbi:MAG: NfeD family protein [Candidatus Ancaeobacter aquaticus]|nr:NfeD family protein [Candidatus Ancaeobacter aquaticus]
MNIILILLIVGLIFLCAEIFLPGMICGIIGTICIIVSIIMCYMSLGTEVGTYYLGGTIVITSLAIFIASKLFPKTKLGRSLTLQTSESNYSPRQKDLSPLLHQEGLAISFLRPSGIAEIQGERIDVVSDAEYIERGSKIMVISIKNNKVIVKKI